MGLTPFGKFLGKHARLALDTSIFIYSLEENPEYADVADEISRYVDADHDGTAPPDIAVATCIESGVRSP